MAQLNLADGCLIVGFGLTVAGMWLAFGTACALIVGGLGLIAVGRSAYRAGGPQGSD